MTLNSYFSNTYSSSVEQSLVQDLITESIKIYGIDCVYLPRTYVNEDELYGEDILSKFSVSNTLEMYLSNVEGFEGQGEFLAKFGIQIEDQVTFIVSVPRFNTEVGQTRPLEGDLIFLPFNDKIYEITFVEHEIPFYQLGNNYVYGLRCEQFTYSQERFETGNTEIDSMQNDYSYTIVLTLSGGSGDYEVNEKVYQGSELNRSTANATVVKWNSGNLELEVSDIVGTFANDTLVIGNTSGASRKYISSNTEIDELTMKNIDDDNLNIENEADSIIDFTEDNPFSEERY